MDNEVDTLSQKPLTVKQLFRKGSVQLKSVLPLFLILTSCALQYANSITEAVFQNDKHLHMAWFTGSLLGGIISTFSVYAISTKVIFGTAAILTLVCDGLLLAMNSYKSVLSVRYVSGVGYGLAFIPGIINAAEIADNRLRGALCSIVSLGQITALCLGSVVLGATDSHKIPYAVLSILISFVGLSILYWTIESPTYYIVNGMETKAEESLRTLRKESINTSAILMELEETKHLVGGRHLQSRSPFAEGNGRSVLSVTLLRIIYAKSMSVPLVIILSTFVMSAGGGRASLFIVVICRMIFEWTNVIFIDGCGHHKFLRATLGPSGVVLLIFAIIFEATDFGESIKYLSICIILYQVLSGWSLGTSSATYMGQSFEISKKPESILIVHTIEMLVHLVAVALYDVGNYLSGQFFIISTMTILVGMTIRFWTPNTTGKSLKDTQRIMRQGCV